MFSRDKKLDTTNVSALNDLALQQVLEAKRCGHCRQNCQLSTPKWQAWGKKGTNYNKELY